MNKKKLNIGIFTYDFFPIFGGLGRHVYEIYKQNLINKKTNLFIFSPASNNLKKHIQLFPETKKSKFKNIEYSLKINRDIEKIITKYKLDIVHIHGGPGGLFLFKKLSVPVIYTTHHTYWQQSHYLKGQKWKKIFYWLEKNSYRFADYIICVSKDTQQIIIDHYAVNREITNYIPNGITTNEISTIKKIKKTGKNILYVGRIDKRKGIDFLVHTMKEINAVDKGITLHVVGTGKDEEKLKKFSKQNNLPIKFYGFISDEQREKLYSDINVQIVPSIFEGFGISVLEGMAKGVPIIATNVDGIKGIINHDYSGVLTDYGDTQALSNSIIQLLNDPIRQEKYIKNSYKEIKKYAWEKIYLETILVYEKFIF